MGQRLIRVNELLKREISLQLHTRYKNETVSITITDVDTSPDLRNAKVFYSVIGGEEDNAKAGRFFAKHKREIRQLVGKQVTLKYLPSLEFIPDNSIERGSRLIEMMDELEEDQD